MPISENGSMWEKISNLGTKPNFNVSLTQWKVNNAGSTFLIKSAACVYFGIHFLQISRHNKVFTKHRVYCFKLNLNAKPWCSCSKTIIKDDHFFN